MSVPKVTGYNLNALENPADYKPTWGDQWNSLTNDNVVCDNKSFQTFPTLVTYKNLFDKKASQKFSDSSSVDVKTWFKIQ